MIGIVGGYRPDCCLLAKDTPEILNVDVVGSHLAPLRMAYNAIEVCHSISLRCLQSKEG